MRLAAATRAYFDGMDRGLVNAETPLAVEMSAGFCAVAFDEGF